MKYTITKSRRIIPRVNGTSSISLTQFNFVLVVGPSMRTSYANSSTLRPLTTMIYDPRISGHTTKKKNTRFHLLANANGVNPVLTYTESVTWWNLTQHSSSGILLILLATISIISSRSLSSWSWLPVTTPTTLHSLVEGFPPSILRSTATGRCTSTFCQHHELTPINDVNTS